MKVLHLHPGPDTAGQSMAGKRTFEALGDEVRVFVRSRHRFGYDAAETWEDELVRACYRWADVVVLHNEPDLLARAENGRRRPEIVVHHHGSRFRTFPDRLYAEGEAIGARQIVSTLDLLLKVPEGKSAGWIPQVIDVNRMTAIRELHRPTDGRLRVSHAPTNKAIKGTRDVIRAMRSLRREADFVLIQGQPWTICLAMKASTDLFVDQLNLGYGNNALEAWAMGLPVVASAHEPILDIMRATFGGELPFYLAPGSQLASHLRRLLAEPALRAEWAERGRAHVERYHAPAAWAERVRRLYLGEAAEKVA